MFRVRVYLSLYKFLLFGIYIFAQAPSGTLTSSSNSICTGQILQLTLSVSGSPDQIFWNMPYGASVVANSNNTLVSVTFTQSGIKTLSVVLANASGSTQLLSTHSVISTARASFLAVPNHSALPAVISLTNFSSSFILTEWVVDNNFSSPLSGTVTEISLSNPGTHSISLVAYGNAGCNDTNSYIIRLFDKSSLILPNIFTPNSDGVNDIYRPIMQGIKSIHVWIYNRWGILVREWDQIHGFWDGFTSSDMACPDGTYFVVCEAVGVDEVQYKLKSSLQLSR